MRNNKLYFEGGLGCLGTSERIPSLLDAAAVVEDVAALVLARFYHEFRVGKTLLKPFPALVTFLGKSGKFGFRMTLDFGWGVGVGWGLNQWRSPLEKLVHSSDMGSAKSGS